MGAQNGIVWTLHTEKSNGFTECFTILERSHSWSSALVSKTGRGESSSRVRIPPSPPLFYDMKKVFIVHGFQGSPNGGWRPWLMSELEKLDVYACALAMPSPDLPVCNEWVEEVSRHITKNSADEIFLVGHSLGVPAILRYIESADNSINIFGAVLVSGPIEKNSNRKIDSFFESPFEFEKIKSAVKKFVVIQGDDDPNVPLSNAQNLSKILDAELILIPNGGHLNGSSGWRELPQCLEALKKMLIS